MTIQIPIGDDGHTLRMMKKEKITDVLLHNHLVKSPIVDRKKCSYKWASVFFFDRRTQKKTVSYT